MRYEATFRLLSLLRRISRLPLIFDASTFTRTSLLLRSYVLRQNQYKVLPRLRMSKPTIKNLANIMINAITAGFYFWHAIKNGSHERKL
jgi:hypothetical protein